ncbi:MAG TPA: site-specific integrase [Oscillospiraceae bacterium]|jgi:integrase|nr:site-specific integrase [Oscillospiraceae bacterium]
MTRWQKTSFPGVRYREHDTRKHGVKKDRYFTIRYKVGGRDKEEGLGWASEGWTAAKAYDRLSELKKNLRVGEGPQTLAEKREAEARRRKEAEAARKLAERTGVTFGTFIAETYLPWSEREKAATTCALEKSLYRQHIAGVLDGVPLNKVSSFHLERIKKNMADTGKSPRTIQYVLQLTRHVFNTARRLGVYAGESPTRAVKWPKVDNMKMRYLSVEEAKRLLAALRAKSQILHDIALLSLHCGLRFGEIAALTWSCVNWQAGTLAILNAKTGSRTAYLTEEAKAMLRAREQGDPGGFVFPKRGGDGTMKQVSKAFADTVKELGFNEGVSDRKQKVTFHTLRHTYATHLYEATHDLYLTQKSLGHATVSMTARYAKMSESRLREGTAALEKSLL